MVKDKLKIIVADDHCLFSESLKMNIENTLKYNVVALVKNGIELLKILESTSCDFILMDIMMDEMDGITATKIISKKYPNINIIGISMYKEQIFILDMLQAGAKGFLSKDFHSTDLFNAINIISDGNLYFTSDILKCSNEKFKLTIEESNVINLVADGSSSKEISRKLLIGIRKIEKIKSNLVKKFGARNIPNLIKLATIRKKIRI